MTTRVTTNLLEKWQRDLERADLLIERTLNHMIAAKMSAKGGNLTDLTTLVKNLCDAKPGRSMEATGYTLATLQKRNKKRVPIEA